MKFLDDVEKVYRKYGWVSIVCGEGLKYKDGTPVSSSMTADKFNNIEFGAMGGASVGLNLHRMISDNFGFRGEFQITESLIMSDIVRGTNQDVEEAYQCGLEAIKIADQNLTGYMVTMNRVSNDPYTIAFGRAELKDVAVKAKPMPKNYFNEEGNFVSPEFLPYIRPLIGELPEFVELEKLII